MRPGHVLLQLCLVVVLYSRTLRTRPLDRNPMEELRPPDGAVGSGNRLEERAAQSALEELEEEEEAEVMEDFVLEELEDSAVKELEEEEEEEEEVEELEEEEEEEEALADGEERMERLLGSVKEDLLRKLNLSSAPQEQVRVRPPDFMVQLYNTYAADQSSTPRADVIRSFSVQDVSLSESRGGVSRHRFLFNISVPASERVSTVQLRLYTQTGPRAHACSSGTAAATIRVYQLENHTEQSSYHFLDEREVAWSRGSWEMFDVTAALWSEAGCGVAEFEVRVQRAHCGGGAETADVSGSLAGNTSAVLIVFSNDQRGRRREAQQELQHTLSHEDEAVFSGAHEPRDASDDPNDLRAPQRRHAASDYCRRTSLRVNFKDIGWHEWIVAPPEYEAYECKGTCQFPLSPDVTPSKHAIIQSLVNLRHPGKANMACCVPTKLDPITIMYQENGVITVRHLYEEMRVAACGCR
ncbi:growth/differentiation factor 2 [Alosa pseudoharengus]|uniref:growth/differentiation factor 2 n=1 Tax=Alosa pseudoharengus TaxID=34774 RepID=UPI003F8A682A